MNELGRDYLYQQPWICYKHGYFTMDKEQYFNDHMAKVEHYGEGTNGTCESCKVFLPNFRYKFLGLEEPPIHLCPTCQLVPDIINKIREKRKAVYPGLMKAL